MRPRHRGAGSGRSARGTGRSGDRRTARRPGAGCGAAPARTRVRQSRPRQPVHSLSLQRRDAGRESGEHAGDQDGHQQVRSGPPDDRVDRPQPVPQDRDDQRGGEEQPVGQADRDRKCLADSEGKRANDRTTPNARHLSWSRSMPVAFQARRTTLSPAMIPTRITSGTAAVNHSATSPTIVPPVNGLWMVSDVPSTRSRWIDQSPRRPPTTPRAIPTTSSRSSTRPKRDVTLPLGNRTFTGPERRPGTTPR